ncbi:hypothetical protein [Pleurocapsa sp. FMAR1]|uniref:hypothetical protein n=1 Tax=Pleurocapsa sp. FMAR1 TaxID=3040204 RepID=UPI0029C6B740|nr:hypothetical protein [Pleurocapsa sp. FMAR1]
MIFLKIEKLEQKNIHLKGKTKIVFQNKSYEIKTVISKKFQNQITEIAEKYQLDGLDIMIVEYKSYFAIWREINPLQDTKEDLNNFINQKLKDLGI